jgi:hypothetical protein
MPIDSAYLQPIEDYLEDVAEAHNEVLEDYVRQPGYAAASGTNELTVTLDPAPTAYVAGMGVCLKTSAANTGAVTINVNGLGVKSVLKSNGSALSSGNLKANSVYTVRYNGTNFILQGEGGEYGTAGTGEVLDGYTFGTEEGLKNGALALTGNATAGNVLAGRTFYSNNAKSKQTGTMPDRGAVNQSLAINGSYTIPAGYHNGSGKVSQSVATKGAATINPTEAAQTIAANQWLSGIQTIGAFNSGLILVKKSITITLPSFSSQEVPIPEIRSFYYAGIRVDDVRFSNASTRVDLTACRSRLTGSYTSEKSSYTGPTPDGSETGTFYLQVGSIGQEGYITIASGSSGTAPFYGAAREYTVNITAIGFAA